MNQCKYCGVETPNLMFCSKQCQARYNVNKNHNTYVQFKCQKHDYFITVHTTKFKRTKCPQCVKAANTDMIHSRSCAKCGILMQQYYGSGRFCSRSCANSRAHSNETKLKISDGVGKYYGSSLSLKQYTCTPKICVVCSKQVSKSSATNRSTCSQQCHRVLIKLRAKEKSSDPKIRQKLSVAMKKRVAEGRHTGWNSRKHISYPEKFFMDVLLNNGIEYVHNFKVVQRQLDPQLKSYFFLDFFLPKYNIDLQIDGKQHKYNDAPSQDKRRDILLSKKYEVYRIEWNQINSDYGKLLMKQKIDKFLVRLTNG